ncbi:hypothetical protein VaNZ11_007186 [Volvox africanus]|uniref:Uncharacterized protein n=1 Tax=Volvox africanus TaxID=51714 RepID=A0ABQ5S2N1_9CHLO|nr:hypothetical protein VaNZ11_007186 [Volvox africanus]
MSRKREGLVELLHWSRRPSTCGQIGPRKEREERPNTGKINGSANGGSSERRQASQLGGPTRGGLPPLSRTGSMALTSVSNGAGGSSSPEPPAETLSHFQEALYTNGQPHNATSRLLRLGANSPLRRSVTAGPMPPLPTPPSRIQSASHSASGMTASPESAGGNAFLPSPLPLTELLSFRQQQPQAGPQQQQATQQSQLASPIRPSTAWTAPVAGSPPRALQRFGSRETTVLMDEARRKAQEAMEVLCGDQEISPETRAQATAALQELEALLGPREVNLTALVAAARNLRSDLCKELHNTEKQASFARAQMKSLERQHDILRHQLRTRPEPIVLPAPAVSGLSDTGTPSMSPKNYQYNFDTLAMPCSTSGSLSAPHSPMGHARQRFDSAPPLPPRPGYYAAAAAAIAASGGDSIADGGSGGYTGDSAVATPAAVLGSGGLGGFAGAVAAAAAAAATTASSAPSAVMPSSSPSFGERSGAESAGGGMLVLSDKWSLAQAMERTLRMRAINRVEAALQALAAEQAAQERPQSSRVAEVAPPVDVEELRRLKHAPQGMAENLPSYIGVSVRRTPSPGPLTTSGEALMVAGMRSGSGTYAFTSNMPNGGGPGSGALDPRAILQWSNRGISTNKMPLLKEALAQSPQLVRLCLVGNKLSNEDVMELVAILSGPTAPRVQELFLDQNTNLSWRCALPLALALGMSPDMAAASTAADWAAVAAAMPPSATPASIVAPASVPSARDRIHRLDLRVLSLCGVKLGDKGVAQLAEGLRANNALRELDLRRCGISDSGGAVLMDVLESNGRLQRLDVSWNALRSESARVLEMALAGNAGLRELSLAHNGFGDLDGARIIKGLLNHGRWVEVDLSHNTLGPGSCMMVGELLRRLGAAATSLMLQGTYADCWPRIGGDSHHSGWAQKQQQRQLKTISTDPVGPAGGAVPPLTPGGKAGANVLPEPSKRFNGLADERSAPPSPTTLRISAGQLGSQLHKAQPSLALDGNPLGSTGLRIILDAMEAMSQSLLSTAGLALPDPSSLRDDTQGTPPLPLHITISNCNVAPPSERSGGADSGDEANPFLPSIAVLCRPPGGSGDGRLGAAKDAAIKKAAAGKMPSAKEGGSKDSRPPPTSSQSSVHTALNLQSPHLDLQSPAGVYSLDLAHPATAVLVVYLLRMREQLNTAVEAGVVAASVAVSIGNITVNGKSVKLDQLAAVDSWTEGTLQLQVKAPAVLALQPPAPLTPMVAQWLASLLVDPTVSPLWKLSVIQAAGSVCFFTPGQCLALLAGFDRDTQSAECVAAAQMLYARSAQPLAFWEHVLSRLSTTQQASLRERVGDLVALDMTRPMGRYTLNLSRQVDRFVALRLQLASALENSWLENKYYINWLNASFNGHPLDRPGLTHIRDYTLPGAGVLRLDYVSYVKPGLGMPPAPPEELAKLLAHLRSCNMAHITALLQVRAQVMPPPPPPPPRREHLRSPIGRRKLQQMSPPAPKPRLSAFQLMHASLLDVARFLASPGPPPPTPPGHDGAVAVPPLLPISWTRACGFDPELLFRRTGVLPPEFSVAGYSIPPSPLAGEVGPPGTAGATGPLPDPGVVRAVSLTGKSAKNLVGRSSVATPSGRASRRRSARDKEDENEWEVTQAEYHAALFGMIYHAKDLPLLASKMGASHLGAAVSALLRYDGGVRAAAALLTALPPLAASKFLYDQTDPSPCLLPPEARKQLLAAMPPERVRLVETAARGASEAALCRARQVRTALNLWASQRLVSCEQVEAVLDALHTEGDRVAAMVVLWPRLVDGRWKRTYMKMKLSEQRQVMIRLGFWHVYTCLADPHGISFSLDLGEPEQRDIARELVRMAVKETMRAKQDARARGGMYSATLLDLHGNGNPVSIPEDEKLWGMADSNFKTMDFLYSPTFEQSLERVAASAVQIQRFWAALRANREARMARAMANEGIPGMLSS